MTNNKDAQEELRPEAAENITEQPRTPGEILREARELAGLSVGQVADRLRLRHTQIAELESNEFTKYVSDIYIRGYLRSYAKLLQIDESKVMDAYRAHFGVQQSAGSMQTFSNKKNIESQDNRLMIITWIIVLILIGSVAVFVWQQFMEDRNHASSVPASTTESASVAADLSADNESDIAYLGNDMAATGEETSTTEMVPEDILETNAQSLDTTELQPVGAAGELLPENSNPNEGTSDLAVEQVNLNAPESSHLSASEIQHSVSSEDSGDASDIPASLGELVLVFTGDSWVRIEDGRGEAIAYGVKVDGHVMPLTSEGPYQLTLGAPQAVTVYFRGEQVDLSEFRGGRVARFSLPRSE